ncbi:MAG: D-TA family PLP-dependent enzyme [Candidatus Omnitrophica bacterium]|nr:D-TA family PLP-dependent enzyme [Candidatus Omnitrophota bacterium]
MSQTQRPPPPWFEVENLVELDSPALLIYRDRLGANLRRMIDVAGRVDRLRPHIKTHKIAEVISIEIALGITKFKCATIAEAELAADSGVTDLLLAYPLVGPNIQRLAAMAKARPGTRFSTIADDAEVIRALSHTLQAAESHCHSPGIEVLLDIDVGQHRTGVSDHSEAVRLYGLIASMPGLRPGGLHAYDGHISDSDLAARTAACEAAFAPVAKLRHELLEMGLSVPRVVAGGTPTFPIHAQRGDVECSPGTCVFWDAGYATKLPDLRFTPAALVLTRVVSKPGINRLCLDLGHKAIASEMPHPRVRFLNLPDARAVAHSEEHLTVETPRAAQRRIGDCLYGVPWHICPTVALYREAVVIQDGKAIGRWRIAARDRRLTF